MNWQPGQVAFIDNSQGTRAGRLVTIARVTKSGRAIVTLGDTEVTFTPAGAVYGEADRRHVDPWSRLTPVQEGDDVLDAAWRRAQTVEKQRKACESWAWLINKYCDKMWQPDSAPRRPRRSRSSWSRSIRMVWRSRCRRPC